MSDQEESVWVVFNGEIYNFPELKKQLEALGHVFRTRCDTEVIVLGYKQWGDEVLNRLNGMFGLAFGTRAAGGWWLLATRLELSRSTSGSTRGESILAPRFDRSSTLPARNLG